MKYTWFSGPYESEFAQFINEFKRRRPDIEKKQREARAIWWDKPPLSVEEVNRASMPELRMKPYEYD